MVTALPLPLASCTALAATLTPTTPVVLGVGTTTSVALVPLMRVKAPLVPPATTTSSTVKLVPTFSLKPKLKSTSPVAVAPSTLSVMVTTGPVVSAGEPAAAGGASPSPPPQAASSSTALASSRRRGVLEGERDFMAVDPGEVDGPDALRETAVADGPDGSVPKQRKQVREGSGEDL